MHGTSEKPRLFVYRSNQHIYAQLIDDGLGASSAKILISVSDKDIKQGKGKTKSDIAKQVGGLMAKKAEEYGVTIVTNLKDFVSNFKKRKLNE